MIIKIFAKTDIPFSLLGIRRALCRGPAVLVLSLLMQFQKRLFQIERKLSWTLYNAASSKFTWCVFSQLQ